MSKSLQSVGCGCFLYLKFGLGLNSFVSGLYVKWALILCSVLKWFMIDLGIALSHAIMASLRAVDRFGELVNIAPDNVWIDM